MNPRPTRNGTSTFRLWTFQHAAIVPALRSAGGYRTTWSATPENWRIAYAWMTQELGKATHPAWTTPPVWCWHSCNGRRGEPPTIFTATALLNAYQIEQGMVTVELAVPREFVLLSSYYAWNRLLEFAIVNQRLPKNQRKLPEMFLEPLFKHQDDDIQAVIPGIRSEWVRGIWELAVVDRTWDAPVIPEV